MPKASKPTFAFSEAVASLPEAQCAIVEHMHGALLAHGFTPTCTRVKDTSENWKCEYARKLPRQTLCALLVKDGQWSIRCKLYSIADYQDALADCTPTVRACLSKSGNCGSHAGGCKGALTFTLEGQTLSKCRHALVFRNLELPDADSLLGLLRREIL